MKKCVALLAAACLFVSPLTALAEETDFSFLEDMSIKELRALDEKIHELIGPAVGSSESETPSDQTDEVVNQETTGEAVASDESMAADGAAFEMVTDTGDRDGSFEHPYKVGDLIQLTDATSYFAPEPCNLDFIVMETYTPEQGIELSNYSNTYCIAKAEYTLYSNNSSPMKSYDSPFHISAFTQDMVETSYDLSRADVKERFETIVPGTNYQVYVQGERGNDKTADGSYFEYKYICISYTDSAKESHKIYIEL